MKYVKITKDFFKDCSFEIKMPTFTCRVCGEEILDCPQPHRTVNMIK